MFNQNKRLQLQDIISINSGTVRKGEFFNYYNHKVKIPQFEELFKSAIYNIKEIGFSVKRVAPQKANAVIRVFRHENLQCDDCTYWMYGTDIFLKEFGKFYSVHFDKYEISFDKCAVKIWFYQDEYTHFKPHFVDYFVKIS